MAHKLPLVQLPAESLRKKAILVDPKEISSKAFQNFLDNMIESMRAYDGVGIAAVQVGDPRSVAIVSSKDGPIVIINPKILRHGLLKERGEEGCLSVPGIWALVKRSKYVRVAALDRTGRQTTYRATGLMARVFQHEIDHLEGFLIVDRAEKILKIEPK